MAKEKVRVSTYVPDPPFMLKEFVGWLDGIIASIPSEAVDGAHLDLSAWEDYGGISREWTLTYWRDETDEERRKRLAANERKAARAREARVEAQKRKAIKERETYEELKRKFG